jgi:hypothetical protein
VTPPPTTGVVPLYSNPRFADTPQPRDGARGGRLGHPVPLPRQARPLQVSLAAQVDPGGPPGQQTRSRGPSRFPRLLRQVGTRSSTLCGESRAGVLGLRVLRLWEVTRTTTRPTRWDLR